MSTAGVSSRGTIGGLAQRTGQGRLHKPRSRKALLALGGATSDRDWWFLFDAVLGYLGPTCDAGYCVAAPSVLSTWGNAAIRADMLRLFGNVVGDGSAQFDRIHLLGVSAGGLTALNFAFHYPAAVRSISLLIPALPVQDLYDTDRGGFASAIGAAYGGRPSDADDPTRHPEFYQRFPIQLHYSESDTVALPEQTEEFASRSGAELISMGSIGHSFGAPFSGEAVRDFVEANDEPWLRTPLPLDKLIRWLRPAIFLPLDYRNGGSDETGDWSGNGRDGTLLGELVVGTEDGPKIPWLATIFDGADDYVTTTYAPFAGVRTFVWCASRYDSPAGDDHTILAGSTATNGPVLRLDADANDVSWLQDGSTAVTWSDAWPGDEQWAVGTLVVDDSANTATLWINGQRISQQTAATAYNATPGNLWVGARNTASGAADFFAGGLCHVAVYERELLRGDIRSIHKAIRQGVSG